MLILYKVRMPGEKRKEMVKQTDRQRNGSGMLRACGDFRRN